MVDLSIIIPHFNSVSSLEKLLLSIPNYENIQIIVIDDNSNEQLTELKDLMKRQDYKHVQFLKNTKENKGAGACRNIGLNKAMGKWVLFADADDFFVQDFYSIIYKYFDSNYDVIYFKPTSIKIDTGEVSDRHIKYEKLINDYIESNNRINETRLKYRFFVPWSKLINRKFINENSIFFDEVMASNDIMFSTKVGYYLKEFKVVPETIYCVTRGYGTLTTNKSSHLYDARVAVFIENYKFLKDKLDKEDFKSLHLHGLGVLLGVIRNQLGVKKLVSVYGLLRKNKVKVFDGRLIDPRFAFMNVKEYSNKYFNERKYYKSNP